MGAWYISIAASLLLVLTGLYTHWALIVAGALLPFVPVVSFLAARRRQRRVSAPFANKQKDDPPGP